MSHTVFFPIETLGRELEIRLIWATALAKMGLTTFLGDRRVIHTLCKDIKNGIYVGKQAYMASAAGRHKLHNRLVRNNFLRIYMEEEGAVFVGKENDWRVALSKRSKPETMCNGDHIFTWGKFQKEHYEKLLPNNSAVTVTTVGHPRFDIYRSPLKEIVSEQTNELLEQYGKFVLFNTNVTLANNGAGTADTFSKRFGFYGDEETRLKSLEKWSAHVAAKVHITELVHFLATKLQRQNINIVVRPHPSEALDFYEQAFRMLDNVYVVRQGPIAPWILACETLVHDGCTTAIEATIAGKPVINYRPNPSSTLDLPLPNALGRTTGDSTEVLDFILNGLPSYTTRLASETLPEDLLENLNQPCNHLFIKSLYDLINMEKRTQSSLSNFKVSTLTKSKEWEDALKLHTPGFRKNKKSDIRYQRGKFPGILTHDATRIINAAEKMLSTSANVRFFGKSIIKISPAS